MFSPFGRIPRAQEKVNPSGKKNKKKGGRGVGRKKKPANSCPLAGFQKKRVFSNVFSIWENTATPRKSQPPPGKQTAVLNMTDCYAPLGLPAFFHPIKSTGGACSAPFSCPGRTTAQPTQKQKDNNFA
jgi:hypothetical protein